MKRIVVALVLTGIASLSIAQQTLKPEEMIHYRKAGLSFISWNMGKIKANIDGSYDKDQVAVAANSIAAAANSGLFASLFVPGTDKEIGGEKTRARPEVFQQPDKFRDLGAALAKEANELAKLASAGDAGAVKGQFGKVARACKNCHDDFRKD